MTRPRVVAFGDSAVLVELGWSPESDRNRPAQELAEAVRELALQEPGYGSPVPGLGNLLVPVDPEQPGVEAAIERLADLASRPGPVARDSEWHAPLVDLPTRYGGPEGPDLLDVADRSGLRPAEVVELHASTEYRVLFLGFAPGFAYLGDVPKAIAVPRLDTPRTRVPAGSVGLAGRQTAVYPFDSPGGWRLIGRTAIAVWDATRQSPVLLTPGARVRFIPEGHRDP